MTQTPPISAEQVEALIAELLQSAHNIADQFGPDAFKHTPQYRGAEFIRTAAASIPARGVERDHDWAGGNDTCYCRRCGIEYAYGKEPKPLGGCPGSPAPQPVQEQET